MGREAANAIYKSNRASYSVGRVPDLMCKYQVSYSVMVCGKFLLKLWYFYYNFDTGITSSLVQPVTSVGFSVIQNNFAFRVKVISL